MQHQTVILVFLAMVCISVAVGADVPGVLPGPDTTPPADGKVNVYILAGQSNSVGFGAVHGSLPIYPSIFLSADPAFLPCRMPVGSSALLPHGVDQSATKTAVPGAKVAIYADATFGVLLREHCRRRWSDAYFLADNSS